LVGTAPGAGRARWIDCPTQSYGAEAAANNATAGSRYQQYFPYL